MANRIKIALIDDHVLVRRGLRETLGECREFEVVGEGATADEAVSIVESTRPDIILLDVNMPGGGLTAVDRITKLKNNPKILMLTVYDNLANVRAAMTGGASGYVLKGVGGDELVNIIKSVYAGGKHISPELAVKLFSETVNQDELTPSNSSRYALLTKREMQILKLIQLGFPNADIAKKLKLSEATVKHYITPLFRKLSVRNRTEAALLKGQRFS